MDKLVLLISILTLTSAQPEISRVTILEDDALDQILAGKLVVDPDGNVTPENTDQMISGYRQEVPGSIQRASAPRLQANTGATRTADGSGIRQNLPSMITDKLVERH